MNEIAPINHLMLALRRYLTRLWLGLRYRVLDHSYHRLIIEKIDNIPLIILPDVFNPVLFRTGEFLARALQTISVLNLDSDRTPLVLDLGCGSGVGAIFAARRGARVIAVDLNPEAYRCTKLNILLNHFEDKIEARLGNLFEPVKGECFDLVLFNPPFYQGPPKDNLDMAWRGEKIFERFAAELKGHLTPMGQALIVISTDGDGQIILKQLEANLFTVTPILRHDFGNEVITVYLAICH